MDIVVLYAVLLLIPSVGIYFLVYPMRLGGMKKMLRVSAPRITCHMNTHRTRS